MGYDGSEILGFQSEVKAFRLGVYHVGVGREVLACPFRFDVLVHGSSSEVVYKCPFCVCVFGSFSDLELHLNAFGGVGSFHHDAWRFELLRRDIEWGAVVGAGRGFRKSHGSWFSERGL